MAITKQNKVIIAAGTASVAGTSTKIAPSVTGTVIDCTGYYGGELTYRITNSTAPTVACAITFQVSSDGTTGWTDYFTTAGDLVASSAYSGTVDLRAGVMWVRAIAYGNATNNVTVEAALQAITGV